MRGLTLYQPSATLIALSDAKRYPDQGELCKRIETRPRRISYLGPIAIHAGKLLDQYAYYDTTIRESLAQAGCKGPGTLPLGKVVAVAHLFECFEITSRYSAFMQEHFPNEYAFGDYRPGRWAWLLVDITALPEPIPCRGMQGLWHVPPDVQRRLAEMGVAG